MGGFDKFGGIQYRNLAIVFFAIASTAVSASVLTLMCGPASSMSAS